MISLDLFLPFVAASVALMVIPGPNVALICANSLAHGRRYGLVTVAGTSSAMVLQLVLVGAGLASALGALGRWFEVIRWAGVAYLVVLAMVALRQPVMDLTKTRPQARSARRIWLRGFLVSLANPKTLLFYVAFFPQFIDPARPALSQTAALAAAFLIVAVALDSGWALLADRLRGVLAARGRLRNRLTCGAYLAAGLGLAAVRRV